MDYRLLFKEENMAVAERFDLSMERINHICLEETVKEPYRDFFRQVAGFICMIGELYQALSGDGLKAAGIHEWKEWNQRLYADVLPEQYEHSYANPAYAVKMLGIELGQLFSYLYSEIRGDIVFAFESRLTDITILNEVFIELYNMFEQGIPEVFAVKETLYWFVSDYTDHTVAYRVRECVDPTLSFALDIIMKQDLNDLRYLYRFGEYITDSELELAGFLNSLPEATVKLMADTYTEGFRRGFEVMGRDLSKKKTVMIRYELGFERMVRYAVGNFRNIGLEPFICRAATWSVNRNPVRKIGYYGSSPNKQYEYDHRYDHALYLNKAYKDRKLAVLRTAYTKYKKEASSYAGPALIETFGHDGFQPVNRTEVLTLNEKQEKLTLELANESTRITNEFIPGHETSFTIIAFPVPDIGKDFKEILKETIAINTLDYEVYKSIQQKMIDALDQASYVTVTGKGDNLTNLRVILHPLQDAGHETNFENCVADVNIPLGEVFTSPVLSGTEGMLHVGNVYIGDIQFKNLKMTFQDGMVTSYSCDNFNSTEEGRALVKQVILKNHETLPMGEFAIGTNTAAYAMAQKFGILNKLPILIVEKMGPHFAVGDTCYSWSEDNPVYNPDGKEIIARDNEISSLRSTDISRAYFSCHTDITIPYSELDRIEAVKPDGNKIMIMDNGRFVLKGLEKLNQPLD